MPTAGWKNAFAVFMPEEADSRRNGPLLSARLYLHPHLRYGAALLTACGALFASEVVGIVGLDVPALIGLAVVIAAYNTGAWLAIRSHGLRDPEARSFQRLVTVMGTALVLDYLALTVAIWLVGGARSPFFGFYLIHVSFSCLLLSRRAAVRVTLFAYFLVTALVVGEWSGLWPARQPEGAISGAGPLDGRFALSVLVVYGLLFAVISVLLISLARVLREGERRVREANAQVARLAEMRREFLAVALHNLQSPIGAASMLLGNVAGGLSGPLGAEQRASVERAKARLDALTGFLRELQTLTTLAPGVGESGLAAQATPVDLGALAREVVAEYADEAARRGLTLACAEVPAGLPAVRGVERLLHEAVANYVTNGLKYTPTGGSVGVRVLPDGNRVRLEVTDTGIGIDPADQPRLFTEFVRLARSHADLGKVEGSGLGLSLVQRIAQVHRGEVQVRSRPGEGSTFALILPAEASSSPYLRPSSASASQDSAGGDTGGSSGIGK
jgi:signal transduction histidine kinase